MDRMRSVCQNVVSSNEMNVNFKKNRLEQNIETVESPIESRPLATFAPFHTTNSRHLGEIIEIKRKNRPIKG